MNLAQQLHGYGLKVFPVTGKKRPAVKGWQNPTPPNTYHWPTNRVGVPIPQGCYIIDIDTYKGVTRQAVEQAIGAQLPWDFALIQRTANGGEHYAFQHNGVELMQGSDLLGIAGFDTRRAGAGFIVTGEGYQQQAFGVARLAHPAMLPALPPAAAAALVKPERTAEKPTKPLGEKEVEDLKQALSHISPQCGRTEWWRLLASARHITADDPERGLEIFNAWSAGEYSQDQEPPSNYVDYDDVEHQWFGTRVEGGVASGTLFAKAMEKGWRPPSGFDVSAVFGQGAADTDTYADMIDDVNSNAINPREQPRLIDEILAFSGSASQIAALKSLMIKALKEDGQLTKQLKDMLDGGGKTTQSATTSPTNTAQLPMVMRLADVPAKPISRATGAHGSNALLMLGEIFANRLASFDGVLRWWSGVEWEKADEDTLNRLASAALSPDQDKMPNVNGTVKALSLKAPQRKAAGADRRIYFQNGILDVNTGMLSPHNPDNNNTGALSVSYNPQAPLGEWAEHLQRIFGGLDDEAERVALLQEIVGWLMITDNMNVQKCIALDGATRAGKGVILDAIAAILGSGKAGFANFADLASGKTQSSFVSHDVMIDHEAKPPRRDMIKTALGFMNKVASNEPVSIELLNTQTPWVGTPNSKYVFACNGIPIMVDDSGASSTRFAVLRFDRSFEGREDRGIGERMKQCYEGIAAWGVIGLQRLIAQGGRFTLPASSAQATNDMKDGNQPLREFLNDWCEVNEGLRCHSKKLWEAYRLYAVEANVKASSKHAFFRSLRATLLATAVEEKQGIRIDGMVSSGFEGIALKSDAPTTANVVAGAFGKKE